LTQSQQKIVAFQSIYLCLQLCYTGGLHMAIDDVTQVTGKMVYHVSWISESLFCVGSSYIRA